MKRLNVIMLLNVLLLEVDGYGHTVINQKSQKDSPPPSSLNLGPTQVPLSAVLGTNVPAGVQGC